MTPTIKLTRKINSFGACIGSLKFGNQEVVTLEPLDKFIEGIEPSDYWKHKKCAIPIGIYDIYYDWSFKRKRMVPELRNVRGFDNIQIHVGNYVTDTDGCILLGVNHLAVETGKHMVTHSATAIDKFYKWLKAAGGSAVIIIEREFQK